MPHEEHVPGDDAKLLEAPHHVSRVLIGPEVLESLYSRREPGLTGGAQRRVARALERAREDAGGAPALAAESGPEAADVLLATSRQGPLVVAGGVGGLGLAVAQEIKHERHGRRLVAHAARCQGSPRGLLSASRLPRAARSSNRCRS